MDVRSGAEGIKKRDKRFQQWTSIKPSASASRRSTGAKDY